MSARAWLIALISAQALLAASHFEKSIPVPRSGEAKLDWSSGGCAVKSVSLQNYPSQEDIDKAHKSDPNDHSWVWWNFHVENRGQTKCQIKLWVDIYGKNGQVVKSGDRTDTVDAGKVDDNIRLSTRMKTIEIADAPKAHLRAEIGPK
jgi:hypothetical protein